VSLPHLWGFPLNHWLHYDANTNSVMERNLGQALGVGAVWDPRTYQSTLNPVNIHRLEMIARRITVPEWPAAFPAVDAAKAARGAELFGAQCAGCHADRPTRDVCYPLDRIGTDPHRALNFATPMKQGGTFTTAVAPVLRQLKVQAYRTYKVPPDQQAVMNGIPDDRVVWRTTRSYAARPLAGVWATAPYLHNGSVPNLYELLSPPERRRTTFPVGHSEYDPDSVGIALTAPRGTATFDTRQPGNGNGGHRYGTTLSEPERLALLEYLKNFREHRGTVTPNNDGIPCPDTR
jgi:mono/diheme cytochrome c family protein